MTAVPPGTCLARCGVPLDPALARAGRDVHPMCEPQYEAWARRARAALTPGGAGPRSRGTAGPAPADPPPPPPEAYDGECGVPDCAAAAAAFPHGRWCAGHARMMAPRTRWASLGVPPPPRTARKPKAGPGEGAAELEAG